MLREAPKKNVDIYSKLAKFDEDGPQS